MQEARPRMTYSDLERLADDGHRYELYEGELVVVPSPILRHQRVVANLADLFRAYARRYGGEMVFAPFDIVLAEHTVLQPNIVYFGPERAKLLQPDKPTRFPPDIAVEVLSPNTELRDRGRKLELLGRYGLPEYWLIDAVSEQIELYELRERQLGFVARVSPGESVRSRRFPDLVFAADAVFQVPRL